MPDAASQHPGLASLKGYFVFHCATTWVLGLGLFIFCHAALKSQGLKRADDMIVANTADGDGIPISLHKFFLALTAFAILSMFFPVIGITGAALQKRTPVCFFVFFCLLGGIAALVFMCRLVGDIYEVMLPTMKRQLVEFCDADAYATFEYELRTKEPRDLTCESTALRPDNAPDGAGAALARRMKMEDEEDEDNASSASAALELAAPAELSISASQLFPLRRILEMSGTTTSTINEAYDGTGAMIKRSGPPLLLGSRTTMEDVAAAPVRTSSSRLPGVPPRKLADDDDEKTKEKKKSDAKTNGQVKVCGKLCLQRVAFLREMGGCKTLHYMCKVTSPPDHTATILDRLQRYTEYGVFSLLFFSLFLFGSGSVGCWLLYALVTGRVGKKGARDGCWKVLFPWCASVRTAGDHGGMVKLQGYA